MEITTTGGPHGRAEANHLAVFEDHPRRRREFDTDVAGEVGQHAQRIRRHNRAVWNKTQVSGRGAVQQRIEVISSCFDDHFLLDIMRFHYFVIV